MGSDPGVGSVILYLARPRGVSKSPSTVFPVFGPVTARLPVEEVDMWEFRGDAVRKSRVHRTIQNLGLADVMPSGLT